MKIIGHRGARALALENSLESIQAALKAGVDAVEFDIRLSADGKFFLSHDATLGRVSSHNLSIRKSTRQEVEAVRLHNGEVVVSLDQALEILQTTPAIIEAKGSGWAKALAEYFNDRDTATVSVISFNHAEIVQFHQARPDIPCYAVERTKPFETILFAHRNGLAGVDFNFWLLNPFTYWYARYYHLQLIVYTVNSRLIAWYFRTFFPRVWITTDVPHHMQSLRSHIETDKADS